MRSKLKSGWLYLVTGLFAAGWSIAAPAAFAQDLNQLALQAQWSRLASAGWIAQGAHQPQHLLYEFIDPNCGYCHALWDEIQTQYPHGLQVRYILVGIISDSSPYKAAAILTAADPANALRKNEVLWGQSPDGSDGGGIQPLYDLDFSMRLELTMHFRLARDFGIIGTPGLVWRDQQGLVHILQSTPRADQLAQIVESATAE